MSPTPALSSLAFALALALAVVPPPAAAAAPCYAPYPGPSRTLETPCSSVVASGGGVEVRDYSVSEKNTTIIENEGMRSQYDEAVAMGAAGVFGYFTGNNSLGTDISNARTVPLLVHPIEAGVWDVLMALSPSLYPSVYPPEGVPAPTGSAVGTNLGLATGLVAARHVRLLAPAQEADFVACGAALRAALPKIAQGAFKVFEQGYYTPTYAYFYAQAEKKDFDVECWAEVERA